MDRWDRREYQMIDLLTKPTGTVTVTDAQNVDHVLPSMLQLIKDVNGLTDDLTGAIAQAQEINSQTVFYSNEAHKSADAASASATAAAKSAADLSAAVTEATSQADKSATSAAAAALSATAAATSKTGADASRDAAKASETAAASSRDTAGFSAAAAQTYRDDAKTARDMASSYSNAPVNVEVSPGKYSAYHWAEQARLVAVGAVVYKGSWDASANTAPPSPKLGDFYFISKAGVFGGVTYKNGDMAVYDGALWERIDNQQAVTTVAGRTGAVTLSTTDIGGLQAVLDAKLSLTGGTVAGPLWHAIGAPGTQQVFEGYGWNNGVMRWKPAMEADGKWALYSYDSTGATAEQALMVSSASTGGRDLKFYGQALWHTGNFDPTTKANVASPVFTGAVTVPSLQVRNAFGAAADMQTTNNYRFLVRDYGTNGITLDSVNPANSVYAPLNIMGTTVTINNQTAWHAGNFDPNSKASLSGAVFTGTVIASNTSFRAQGWGGTATDGVVYFGSSNSYIYKQGGQFSFANEQGGFTASLNSGGTVWTSNNVTPLDRNNGGTLNASIYMANQSAEKKYGWVFSNRTTYLYGNPSSADIGLYDTAGGTRWRSDAANNFYVGSNITAGGSVNAASFVPNSSAGAYLSGNGSGMQWNGAFYLAGTGYYLNAAGNGWARMPRMFVQGNDPGGGAYDGDLWIW